MFKLKEFDYNLPLELIAQEPVNPRDRARLLVVNKADEYLEHKYFFEILNYLKRGDVLVVNDSKVFKARLFGNKKDSGGEVEIFLHKQIDDKTWECLLGGRVKEGLEIILDNNFEALVLKNNQDGTWLVEFNKLGHDFFKAIGRIGHLPLPPYIKRSADDKSDDKNYQTVYANSRKTGSVAAPTAGLHFTPELINKIKRIGVKIEKITLHVGLGTFSPVKTENISEHKMHSEYVEIDSQTTIRLKRAKQNGQRIIAVGTTSCRTLESWGQAGFPDSFHSWTNIFIYPGYQFLTIDALITNFHLPKSTLLMLVSAFGGSNLIKKAYQEAISNNYRFFSYGDAMFIC